MSDETEVIEAEVVPDECPPSPAVDMVRYGDLTEFVPQIRLKGDAAVEVFRERERVVKELMVSGIDYGVIPGTGNKPTLLQPGAQKLQALYGFGEVQECIDRVEIWNDGHADGAFFSYTYKCGIGPFGDDNEPHPIAWGEGNANSYEGKWRWRKGGLTCPNCGKETLRVSNKPGPKYYCWQKAGVSDGCGAKFETGDKRIEDQPRGQIANPDIFALVNTIMAMAQKRAHVRAINKATGMSAFFTTDMDDADVRRAVGKRDEKPAPNAVQPDKNSTNDEDWDEYAGHSATRLQHEPEPVKEVRIPTEEEKARWQSAREGFTSIGISVAQVCNHLLKVKKWVRGEPMVGEALTEAEAYLKLEIGEATPTPAAAPTPAGYNADGTPKDALTAAQAKLAEESRDDFPAEVDGEDPFSEESYQQAQAEGIV